MKAPAKFKVGDRVVTITESPFNNYEVGSLGIVVDTEDLSIIMKKSGLRQFCSEHNIELERVLESPLMRALS